MKVNVAISLLLVSLFAAHTAHALQGKAEDPGLEDYGPEPADDPNAPKDPAKAGDLGDDANKVPEVEEDKTKTKFSDDRFAKLFPSRTGARTFQAKNVPKPKPTLPSFIKGTPPTIKAQLVTTPAPRGGGRRAIPQQATPRPRQGPSTTTTSRPQRGRSTPRQLAGRLPSSVRPTSSPFGATSTTVSPSAAALAAARRRQSSGISRFNRNQNTNTPAAASNNINNQNNNNLNNSTIPALNPRRN